MSSRLVAGIDWAGGQWLAVIFEDRSYEACLLEEDFAALLENEDYHPIDSVVVDVPIGLPDNEETRAQRDELDSLARSVAGRPSSVFPVPSRGASKKAYGGSAGLRRPEPREQSEVFEHLSSWNERVSLGDH